MTTLVRARRHHHALKLSLPPSIPASKFQSLRYSPALSPAANPSSPVIKNLFELEKLAALGHGNGGIVYKVLHKSASSIFALKVLRFNDNSDGVWQQATREAEIPKLVDSLFVIRCHSSFYSNGLVPGDDTAGVDNLSLVMEYMEGGSLQDLLTSRKTLSEKEISTVAGRVLLGFCYLHDMQIVHGDIKPSNLLLNCEGKVKIADFGMSHVVVDGGGVGWNMPLDLCMGTCAYMSPERFDPERWGGQDGFAGDVSSLGVVALECLMGRFLLTRAGQRPDWVTLMCMMCFKETVKVPETASPEFKSFVKRCLEKDWRKRAKVDELLEHPFVN